MGLPDCQSIMFALAKQITEKTEELTNFLGKGFKYTDCSKDYEKGVSFTNVCNIMSPMTTSRSGVRRPRRAWVRTSPHTGRRDRTSTTEPPTESPLWVPCDRIWQSSDAPVFR